MLSKRLYISTCSNILVWFGFFLFFSLYYIIPIDGRLLWQPDEARYAEISREMLASGDWVTPHFLGLRYFEKPIAGYWINSIGQWIFGHNNYAVRFGSILSISLSACLVYWLALRIQKQSTVAVLASLIFLSSLLVYGVGSYAILDPMLTLWLTAIMCCFWLVHESLTLKRQIVAYLLLGISCGMGFMTKGFLAFAVPAIAILPWVIYTDSIKKVLIFSPLVLIGAVSVSLPWILAIDHEEPDFWHYFFWVEHVQRFLSDDAQHRAPFWYYLPVLVTGILPWLGLLPGALWSSWKDRKYHLGKRYLLSWFIMPFLFFSISKGKLSTYILPCFVPLAILLAMYGYSLQSAKKGHALVANGLINLFVGLVGVSLVFIFSPWGVPKLILYKVTEIQSMLLAIIMFLWWALMGGITWYKAQTHWYWASVCVLGVALLIGRTIPQQIVNAKQPQGFIREVLPILKDSSYVISDHVGLASAVAWELKRSDIFLFKNKGELRYGLNYSDSLKRYVASDEFITWLNTKRLSGNVALVMYLPLLQNLDILKLPLPNKRLHKDRIALYFYKAFS